MLTHAGNHPVWDSEQQPVAGGAGPPFSMRVPEPIALRNTSAIVALVNASFAVFANMAVGLGG